MDKKHLTFLVVFFAICLIAVTILFALTLQDNNISGQAVQQDLNQEGVEEVVILNEDDLEGVTTIDDLFNLFDTNDDGSLSYLEFKMATSLMVE